MELLHVADSGDESVEHYSPQRLSQGEEHLTESMRAEFFAEPAARPQRRSPRLQQGMERVSALTQADVGSGRTDTSDEKNPKGVVEQRWFGTRERPVQT